MRVPQHRPMVFVCGLLLILQVASGARAIEPEVAPDTAEELLVALKAKDAPFNNLKLDYIASGKIVTEPFPTWKYPEFAKRHKLENDKPETLQFQFHESVIVRGKHVTCIRENDPTFRPPATRASFTPYQKWSNLGGKSTQITRNEKIGARGNAVMTISAGGFPVDIAQEDAMAAEFAHGIGFGKRIKQIDEVIVEGNRRRIKGKIQIWWEDVSTIDAVLDESLLIRQAIIRSNVKGHRTEFTVQTSGEVQAGQFRLAPSGSFERVSLGGELNGVFRPSFKVHKDFKTQFVRIQEHLTDAEYEQLIEMPEEPGMQVMNYIDKVGYFVGEEPRKLGE